MIRLTDLLKETSNQSIVSGKIFKTKYLTTNSGKLEKAFFKYKDEEQEFDTMGSVLGKGSYFSVTADSSAHYESDDYYVGSDEYELSDNAKILLVSDAQSIGANEIKKIAREYEVDGVYDPTEGQNNNPYLGLVIYNIKVVS